MLSKVNYQYNIPVLSAQAAKENDCYVKHITKLFHDDPLLALGVKCKDVSATSKR